MTPTTINRTEDRLIAAIDARSGANAREREEAKLVAVCAAIARPAQDTARRRVVA